METNVVCAKCGAINIENAKFCNNCGSEITIINMASTSSATQSKKSKKPIIIGIASVAAIFLIVLFAVIIPKAKANALKKKFESLSVGDEVLFGKYEQDGNETLEENIEWIVLDIQDGKYLLLSKYVLDTKPFHDDESDITWENSSIREWLNNRFYGESFTKEEKALIQNSLLKADEYYVPAGNDTYDKVFILSASEVEKYYYAKKRRPCKPTQYAMNKGVYYHEYGWCRWWLRTPGKDMSRSASVEIDLIVQGIKCFENGDINYEGWNNTISGVGIRPAIWVNIGTKKHTNVNNIPVQGNNSGGIGEI